MSLSCVVVVAGRFWSVLVGSGWFWLLLAGWLRRTQTDRWRGESGRSPRSARMTQPVCCLPAHGAPEASGRSSRLRLDQNRAALPLLMRFLSSVWPGSSGSVRTHLSGQQNCWVLFSLRSGSDYIFILTGKLRNGDVTGLLKGRFTWTIGPNPFITKWNVKNWTKHFSSASTWWQWRATNMAYWSGALALASAK